MNRSSSRTNIDIFCKQIGFKREDRLDECFLPHIIISIDANTQFYSPEETFVSSYVNEAECEIEKKIKNRR